MFEPNNTDLWQSICITDPKAVSPIIGKPYKGSSPKPHWLVRRATEVFGACGQGWGIEVKSQGFERLDAENMMHWALVSFWYMKDGVRCATEHMGGTKAMYKAKNNLIYDEDAPKKSVTDAMVKAMSFLGFAGDIFSGLWDDCKYRDFAAECYNPSNQHNQAPQQTQNEPIDVTPTPVANLPANWEKRCIDANTVEQLNQLLSELNADSPAYKVMWYCLKEHAEKKGFEYKKDQTTWIKAKHITASQRDELQTLLTDIGMDIQTFCENQGIDSLMSIESQHFDNVKAELINSTQGQGQAIA